MNATPPPSSPSAEGPGYQVRPAAAAGERVGYAVVYEIAFTYDLAPTMVVKELYVAEPYRRLRVGDALMAKVLEHARTRGCPRLKWDVLPGNTNAKAFYRRWGGQPETGWQAWRLAVA